MRIHWFFGGAVLGASLMFGALHATGLTASIPAQIRFVSHSRAQAISTLSAAPDTGTGSQITASRISAAFLIAGSPANLVHISVTGGDANLSCSYNGAAAGPCDIAGAPASGAGKTLTVNMQPDRHPDGANVAIPQLAVVVTYQ